MTKKTTKKKNTKNKKTSSKKQNKNITKKDDSKTQEQQIPPEMQKKIGKIKDDLEKFKAKLLDKFGDYIVGINVLPPEKQTKKDEKPDPDKVNVLVTVDDSDSKKMSKTELKTKLDTIIKKIGEEISKNLSLEIMLLNEIWEKCYDASYDILKTIALSAPVYDKGMMSAIKIAEIHKTMVLQKFEKYIVSYVLAGSLTQGRATSESDIDVWIVIDDTDVKKMTRAELKDKLRAIIIQMGYEAGEMTGIRNKLNIQVYILTDFWDSLKEANPVIFTLLRDGVPFFDRGIFMPWKQLLKMGKIKPSREAIDMFMHSGEQILERIKHKIKDMGVEDTYYAILTPSQAAIMMYGLPPPTPKETPEQMKEIFVKKEKLLEEKYVKILEDNVKIRKEIEHGGKKELSGKELDTLVTNAEKYLERIKRLFKQIEGKKEKENIIHMYDSLTSVLRDALKVVGIEEVSESSLVKKFENELISKGKLPKNILTEVNNVLEAKENYEKGKITKPEVEKARKSGYTIIKTVLEFVQRSRGREIERAKIRVKYGDKFGEVVLLDNEAFIIEDIDKGSTEIQKAEINKDGSLGKKKKSNIEEYEKALANMKLPNHVFIKQPVFDDLKKIFGKDVEVLVNRA